MLKLIGIIAVQGAQCASLLGLYFTLLPSTTDRPFWHWLLVAFTVIAFIFLAAREIFDHVKSAPRIFWRQSKINSYMRNWISSGGRVVICSRDMSWTGDPVTRQLLLDKAKQNELTVILEKSIELTDLLKQNGAQIVTYGGIGHVPRSRFTIVDFDRDGARVAVGVKLGSNHVIQEFRSGSHPFFAVAEDMIKFLLAYNKKIADVSKG